VCKSATSGIREGVGATKRLPPPFFMLKEFGLALLLMGLVSLAVPFINPNLHYVFLAWIDNWGPSTAWAIRVGVTLVGLLLWLRYRGRD
jgi:hypothetical protein